MISLNETNWKRILSIFSPCGFAVISAEREYNKDKTKRFNKENYKNTGSLLNSLKDKGFQPIVIHGGYQEAGANPKLEKSFLVPFMDTHTKEPYNAEACKRTLMKLGKEFEQDTVLFKMPGDNPKYIVTSDFTDDDGVEHKIGEINMEFENTSFPEKEGDMFFSDIKRKRGPRKALDIDYEKEYKNCTDPEEAVRIKNKINQLKNEKDSTMERLVYESKEIQDIYSKIYEQVFGENVCAGTGAGSISSFAPEHMRGLYVTGSGGGYGLQTDGGKIDRDSTPRPQKIKYAKDCKVKNGESYLMKENELNDVFSNIIAKSE